MTGNGAAVIWLTGIVGDGMIGVGGAEGSEGCALPGIIHSSGRKPAACCEQNCRPGSSSRNMPVLPMTVSPVKSVIDVMSSSSGICGCCCIPLERLDSVAD